MALMERADFDDVGSLDELYRRLGPMRMMPGWNKPQPSLWPEPMKTYEPMHWQYSQARPALEAAARHIGTDRAERRNLLLYNPVEGNTYAAARTMAAAYQLIRPGETARSHRHTPNALRIGIEAGPGTYTVVDGEALPIGPKDVLLTPGWCWHGHYSEAAADAVWIDILDVPLVHLLEPMFYDQHPDGLEPIREKPASSAFLFPWKDIFATLEAAPAASDGRFTRRAALKGAREQLTTLEIEAATLEPGFAGSAFRTTANAIYVGMDGDGAIDVDGTTFEWQPGDVMVVPAWRPHRQRSRNGGVLLRVTDEPALAALGFLRELAVEQ